MPAQLERPGLKARLASAVLPDTRDLPAPPDRLDRPEPRDLPELPEPADCRG